MKIIFIDEKSQIEEIKNYTYDNFIIISLKPHCSYILKKNKINFLNFSDFYSHHEEWKNYYQLINKVETIVTKLNKIKFKNNNLNFFYEHFYLIKIWHDTLYYHSKCLNKIINKFNPKEVYFSKKTKLSLDENLLISNKTNLVELLLSNYQHIKIKYFNSKLINNLEKNTPFSFVQPKFTFSKNFLKSKYFNFKNKIFFYLNYYFKNYRYLSIGSDEVEFFNKESKKLKILNFNFKNKIKFCTTEIDFSNFIEKDKDLKDLLTYKDIKFIKIFLFLINNLSKRVFFYQKEFLSFSKLFEKKKFEGVIFQSMAPFYYPTIIFKKIVEQKKIPFVTWTHGGYFSLSNPGYDVVDYKFCRNHIGYGKYLRELIFDNIDNPINTLNHNSKFDINYVGSFRFDKIHKHFKKNKIKNKFTITFFIGGFFDMSKFYYGYNRANIINSLWEEQFDIIKLISNYSNKYEIIVKDYPTGYGELWREIIKSENFKNVKYISSEKKLSDVLEESDLNIFPWISTTFFEALYYKADICLFEEDLYDGPFINHFNKSLIWSKDLNLFKKKLDKYLDKGDFYLFNKNKLRDYFINFNEKFEEKEKRLITILKSLK